MNTTETLKFKSYLKLLQKPVEIVSICQIIINDIEF